jgi:hypothetical protein
MGETNRQRFYLVAKPVMFIHYRLIRPSLLLLLSAVVMFAQSLNSVSRFPQHKYQSNCLQSHGTLLASALRLNGKTMGRGHGT